MPHHKSAAKRVITNELSRQSNIAARTRLRGPSAAFGPQTRAEGAAAYRNVMAILDRTAAKGVIRRRRRAATRRGWPGSSARFRPSPRPATHHEKGTHAPIRGRARRGHRRSGAYSSACPCSPTRRSQVPLPPPTGSPTRRRTCASPGTRVHGRVVVYSHQADDSAKYLSASSPTRSSTGTTKRCAWTGSSASLIAGEVLFAGGLYLRFLHRPSSHLELAANARRCAFSYRF